MFKKFVLFLALIVCTTAAVAECAAPSAQGLKICFPSNGSTIIGSATFELSANAGSGAISGVAIYDNGVKVDSLGFLPSTLVEGAIHNGTHHVTVKAWDTNGQILSASTSFTMIGYDPGRCTASSTVGVTMCSPISGALEPNNSVPIAFALRTAATAKSWKLYLDGRGIMTSTADTLKSVSTSVNTTAGTHKLSVTAWDSAGNIYKVSHAFTAFYQYDCNPETGACSPGIISDAPNGFGPYYAVDAPTSFRYHAEVVNNTVAIKTMWVTLDGVQIAGGPGPGIVTQVNASPGTHYIIVQAEDVDGKLYATYGTIYVQ